MNEKSKGVQVAGRASCALCPPPRLTALAVTAIAAILTMTAGFAAPDPKHVSDTAPWSNVNRHFAAAIRSGFQVPVTPNPNWKIGQTLADGSVYMISGDLPGWSRSIDGGKRFESAVAGPAFSRNICGGYDETWYQGFESAWAQFCAASGPYAEAIREWQEVSPPVAVPAFYGAAANSGRTVTSGPVPPTMNISQHDAVCRGPANEPGCAKDIIYTGNDWWSFFSPDAGRQWFRLTPQCEMRQPVGWSAIAADRGIGAGAHNFGGHVLAVARRWPGGGATREACGGETISGCQQRSIAWTDDVGEELSESILGTTVSPTASSSRRRTEAAGGGGADVAADSLHSWADHPKWRYATIAHLPAGVDETKQCRVKELTAAEFGIAQDTQPNSLEASIPPRTCEAHPNGRCHARRAKDKAPPNTSSPVDRDAWCLNFMDNTCSCKDGPASNCRYPDPTSAAIDPRNGWAYLTTSVGLLSSPNGGRSWIRQGGAPQSNPADVFKKMTDVDVFVDDPSVRGAKLLTQQFYCSPATDPSCLQDPNDQNSLELNGEAWRILSMGKVDMAFTPCQAEVYYAATPAWGGYGPTPQKRKRGQLSAIVPVEWLVVAHDGTERRTSSVFVAHQRDACDPLTPEAPQPGALEFWDTAHLLRPASASNEIFPDLGDYAKKRRTFFGKENPKLLHSLPASFMPTPLQLRFTAAAVAPSDPRVLWAFSHGVAPHSGTARTDPVASMGTDGHILWRSLDGGATWSIALPANWIWPAKHSRNGGGIVNMRGPDLSVAPANPHKLLLADNSRTTSEGSGADEAWIVEPVPPEQVLLGPAALPEANCSACAAEKDCASSCRIHTKYDMQYGATEGCDPSKVPSNFCGASWDKIMTSSTGGVFKCKAKAESFGDIACDYTSTSDGGLLKTVKWCAALPPNAEATAAATAQGEAELYNTMGVCVGCTGDAGANSASGGAPLPCCVRWRNATFEEVGPLACVQGPPGAKKLDTDNGPTAVTPWFTAKQMTASRGVSGSPDYSSLLLPASFSPVYATLATVAVAGDDGASSVVGAAENPADAGAGGQSGVAVKPDVLAFASNYAMGNKQVWALTSNGLAGGRPEFGPKDTVTDAEADMVPSPAAAAFNSSKGNYLRLRLIDGSAGVTPAALAAAKISAPVIDPSSSAFVVGPNPLVVVDPITKVPSIKYRKTYTSKVRLPGEADIADGWSIPRLRVDQEHLIAASPGIGVITVMKSITLVTQENLPAGTAEPALVDTGKADFVKFEQGPGAVPGGPGVCVTDIEVVGAALYAVVAKQARPNIASCKALTAGLYRAARRPKTAPTACPPANPYCDGFKLVVPFENPHAVEWVPEAANGVGRLVVSDWAPIPSTESLVSGTNAGKAGGGLWSCAVATAQGPTASNCRLVVQGDGIVDVASNFYPTEQDKASRRSGVVFGARERAFVGDMGSTAFAYQIPQVAATAPSPGIFGLDLWSAAAEAAAPSYAEPAGPSLVGAPMCKLSSTKGMFGIPLCPVVSGPVEGQFRGAMRAQANLTGIATGDLAADGIAQSSDGGQGTYRLHCANFVGFGQSSGAGQAGESQWGGLPTAYEAAQLSFWELNRVTMLLEPCVPDLVNEVWPKETAPAWLAIAQATQGPDMDPPMRLPLKKVRLDYGQFYNFASTNNKLLWWSSDLAGAPIAAEPIPNTTNRWSVPLSRSTTEPDALGWARVSLRMATAPSAQIRWTLNGKPLVGAWSPDHTLFWSATTAIIEGPNDLQAICPADSPNCNVAPAEVVFLRAPVEEPLPVQVGTSDNTPSEHAEFWFDTRSEVSLRQGVWALVELADASTPTMLRWNSGPWLPVTDGTVVTGTGSSPGSSAMFRVPVPADALRHGSNLLELQVAPCIGAACFARAGVLSARLVREASDDEDLCLASPEVCGNSLDDDCNGQTDDQGAELCDGPDPDGCANGHAACGSSECNGDTAQAPLSLTAAELSMAVHRIDAVYADGAVVQQPFAGNSIHIGRLLTTGATVSGLTLQLPTSGNNQMVELVIRGTPGGARLPWPGYEAAGGREVEIRSTSADSGQDLHLVFSDGPTTVSPGQPIVLLVETTPGAPSVHSVFGCSDGRLTFPSRLFTRNGCSFPGMDCSAPTGAGAACDVGPVGDPVWGDEDGCTEGHLFPVPGSNQLVCLGDWPRPPMDNGQAELRVTVTGVSYLWGAAEPTPGPTMAAAQVLLRQNLTAGTPLVSVELPVTPSGVPLVGVRLHLLAGSAAFQNASSPEGWQQTLVNSGPEDSGLELDLVLAEPAEFAAARPMAFVAAADLQPDWAATYACSPTETTVPRQILVRLAP